MDRKVTYNYVKWLDSLKIKDKVVYSNGTESWIERFNYYLFDDGFWFKGYYTAHGDTFDYKGETILGKNKIVYLIQSDI